MSLRTEFDSVQSKLQNALQTLAQEDPDLRLQASHNDVRQGLDDILLRQQFWAEDVGYENDPFGIISKEPSDAVTTLGHLTAINALLSEMVGIVSSTR